MLNRLIRVASRLVLLPSAALLVLSLSMPSAYAQWSNCPPSPCPVPQMPGAQQAPSPLQPEAQPPQAPNSLAQEPSTTPEGFGATGGGEGFAAASPNVIGDSILSSGSGSGGSSVRSSSDTAAIRAGAFKISENESPRPGDRVYINYNYFDDVNKTGMGLHREMPGFEKTFLNGDASFGMRLPIWEDSNDTIFNIRGIGNLNMIGKYAVINNRDNGNLVSTGMMMTLPTGRALQIGGANIYDVVLQPYLGYIWNTTSSFYIQGFSSVAVPTDARDITIMFNDVSTGYWLYRSNEDKFLTAVIPTVEGHLNTPLDHRGLNQTVFGIQDSFVMTVGAHFIFRQHAILTIGVNEPLTGPKPFDTEAVAMFNYRF